MSWSEPKSVEAFRQYVRVISGVAFFAVLLYLLVVDRIDIQAMMSIIAGLAGMERIGQAAINHQQAKAREAEIKRMFEDMPDLTR